MTPWERLEIIGPHRLFLGDAYRIAPTLGRFGALVMDPQYEFDTSGGGKFRAARENLDEIEEQGLNKGFDMSIINPLLYPSVVVFSHDNQQPALSTYLAGNYYRQCLCGWKKTNPMPVANKHYKPDFEPYIHAWQENAHPVGDLADKDRIWIGPNGKSDFDHPTVKPLDLMRKIIRNVNADTILDTFMGTGTTGVAAIEYGKTFTGIENNPKHFETALGRIRQAMA